MFLIVGYTIPVHIIGASIDMVELHRDRADLLYVRVGTYDVG